MIRRTGPRYRSLVSAICHEFHKLHEAPLNTTNAFGKLVSFVDCFHWQPGAGSDFFTRSYRTAVELP